MLYIVCRISINFFIPFSHCQFYCNIIYAEQSMQNSIAQNKLLLSRSWPIFCQAMIFLKSMSERVGFEIKRLWIWMTRWMEHIVCIQKIQKFQNRIPREMGPKFIFLESTWFTQLVPFSKCKNRSKKKVMPISYPGIQPINALWNENKIFFFDLFIYFKRADSKKQIAQLVIHQMEWEY